MRSKEVTIDRRPNFFIVGAAKAGTTTLWNSLKKHSNIYMPEDELFKEPAFLSDRQFMTLQEYLDLFSHATNENFLIGEASTCYLACPSSAEQIYHFNPNAKIIILLRNPTDRAYSLYNWMVQDGYEYSSTFEAALGREKKRANKKIPNFFEPEYYWNYMYFRSGLYYQQVKKYIDLFDTNVLVIKFDDFISSPNTIYPKICNFLGLNDQQIELRKENISKSVYHPIINFSIRKTTNIIFSLRKTFLRQRIQSKKTRDFLFSIGMKNCRPPKMLPQTREILNKKFKNDIINLSSLIQADLTDWL